MMKKILVIHPADLEASDGDAVFYYPGQSHRDLKLCQIPTYPLTELWAGSALRQALG